MIWKSDDVLKVPTSSLFRKGNAWAVFALDSGRARLVPVELGQRNGLEAQVISGLEADQEVVVHPGDSLVDGARIVPPGVLTSRAPGDSVRLGTPGGVIDPGDQP